MLLERERRVLRVVLGVLLRPRLVLGQGRRRLGSGTLARLRVRHLRGVLRDPRPEHERPQRVPALRSQQRHVARDEPGAERVLEAHREVHPPAQHVGRDVRAVRGPPARGEPVEREPVEAGRRLGAQARRGLSGEDLGRQERGDVLTERARPRSARWRGRSRASPWRSARAAARSPPGRRCCPSQVAAGRPHLSVAGRQGVDRERDRGGVLLEQPLRGAAVRLAGPRGERGDRGDERGGKRGERAEDLQGACDDSSPTFAQRGAHPEGCLQRCRVLREPGPDVLRVEGLARPSRTRARRSGARGRHPPRPTRRATTRRSSRPGVGRRQALDHPPLVTAAGDGRRPPHRGAQRELVDPDLPVLQHQSIALVGAGPRPSR